MGKYDCIESSRFLMYIQYHDLLPEFIDKVLPHVDGGHGKVIGWDWLVTFWETFFYDSIGCWIMFVSSGPTHILVEEDFQRRDNIGFATDERRAQWFIKRQRKQCA
jgi:hypothetical protein